MDIQTIKESVVSASSTAYNEMSNLASWAGHHIEYGIENYLVPAIQTLWNWATKGLDMLKSIVKNGPGAPFAVAVGLFTISLAAFKIADQKSISDQKVARAVWKVLGILAFTTATAATSLGIAALLV